MPTTIRREQHGQEDVYQKIMGSNPNVGKGIFLIMNFVSYTADNFVVCVLHSIALLFLLERLDLLFDSLHLRIIFDTFQAFLIKKIP